MWVTNNLGYDVELSGVHLYRASQQEVTEAQATSLLANATYILLKTNGQLVQSDSQPDANGQYYVRPLDGVITLNGFPSNPNGSPEVSPLEAFDIGKEEGGSSDLEDNKEVSITENGEIEITPTEGKDGMKKVTATVNVSGGGGVPDSFFMNVSSLHSFIPTMVCSDLSKLKLLVADMTVNVISGWQDFQDMVNLPTDISVSAFCMFKDTLYVGTSSGGIYTSTDGATFTKNTSFPSEDITSFCVFNNTLYVGTSSGGIYTSTDGSIFIQHQSFSTNDSVEDLYVFNNTLLVGTNGEGVYTSTDGDTFTQNQSFPTNYTAYTFVVFNNVLYVGTSSNGIYTSSDGSTFTQNTSFPTNYDSLALVVFNNTLYVGTSTNGIYTSSDGSTFAQNTSFSNSLYVYTFGVFNNILYVGTLSDGIYTSSDGTTFIQNTSFPIGYDVLVFSVFNNTLYVSAQYNGVWISSDGSTFTQSPYPQFTFGENGVSLTEIIYSGEQDCLINYMYDGKMYKGPSVPELTANSLTILLGTELTTQALTPTSDTPSGTVASGTVVQLSTTEQNATIYYYYYDTNATKNLYEYDSSSPIEITSTCTIRAIVITEGKLASEELVLNFTVA